MHTRAAIAALALCAASGCATPSKTTSGATPDAGADVPALACARAAQQLPPKQTLVAASGKRWFVFDGAATGSIIALTDGQRRQLPLKQLFALHRSGELVLGARPDRTPVFVTADGETLAALEGLGPIEAGQFDSTDVAALVRTASAVAHVDLRTGALQLWYLPERVGYQLGPSGKRVIELTDTPPRYHLAVREIGAREPAFEHTLEMSAGARPVLSWLADGRLLLAGPSKLELFSPSGERTTAGSVRVGFERWLPGRQLGFAARQISKADKRLTFVTLDGRVRELRVSPPETEWGFNVLVSVDETHVYREAIDGLFDCSAAFDGLEPPRLELGITPAEAAASLRTAAPRWPGTVSAWVAGLPPLRRPELPVTAKGTLTPQQVREGRALTSRCVAALLEKDFEAARARCDEARPLLPEGQRPPRPLELEKIAELLAAAEAERDPARARGYLEGVAPWAAFVGPRFYRRLWDPKSGYTPAMAFKRLGSLARPAPRPGAGFKVRLLDDKRALEEQARSGVKGAVDDYVEMVRNLASGDTEKARQAQAAFDENRAETFKAAVVAKVLEGTRPVAARLARPGTPALEVWLRHSLELERTRDGFALNLFADAAAVDLELNEVASVVHWPLSTQPVPVTATPDARQLQKDLDAAVRKLVGEAPRALGSRLEPWSRRVAAGEPY